MSLNLVTWAQSQHRYNVRKEHCQAGLHSKFQASQDYTVRTCIKETKPETTKTPKKKKKKYTIYTNKQLIIRLDIQSINTVLPCLSFPKHLCKILLSMSSDFTEDRLSMLYKNGSKWFSNKGIRNSSHTGVQKESGIRAKHGGTHLWSQHLRGRKRIRSSRSSWAIDLSRNQRRKKGKRKEISVQSLRSYEEDTERERCLSIDSRLKILLQLFNWQNDTASRLPWRANWWRNSGIQLQVELRKEARLTFHFQTHRNRTSASAVDWRFS